MIGSLIRDIRHNLDHPLYLETSKAWGFDTIKKTIALVVEEVDDNHWYVQIVGANAKCVVWEKALAEEL